MSWFHRDKPFDVLGTFEVGRLLMLNRLNTKGRVHQAIIHCHDGRFVVVDMGQDHSEVMKNILGMLQIAYDEVATTHMMTNEDNGAEVATAAMFANDVPSQTCQMFVWKARIQRDQSRVVTHYFPLGHEKMPARISTPSPGVLRRPPSGVRAKVLKILAQIPEASAPWIVKRG